MLFGMVQLYWNWLAASRNAYWEYCCKSVGKIIYLVKYEDRGYVMTPSCVSSLCDWRR